MFEVEDGVPVPIEQRSVLTERPPLETHTCKQAMDILNIGHSLLYKLFEEREITPIKVGHKTLVIGLREFIERKAAEARQRAAN